MANTYTQLIAQLVFAVNDREYIISEKYREEIEKYICGIIRSKKSKPLAIYCNPDHLHVAFGFNPDIPISALARDVKANSSRFINEKKWFKGKFSWQEGYGAFSYSKSQLNDVVNYILYQPVRHKKQSFREEYLEMLKKSEIEYDEKYLFKWIE